MAVQPNATCGSFCTWVLATTWLNPTAPQIVLITEVQTAATAVTTVTDLVWNNFLRTTGLWYQYYTAYLAQTVNTASLPSNIVQGDLIYGSASNTLARLAKSTTANSFLKNSGTSNNPAWSTIASTALSDVVSLTDYSATSTIVGWSSFTSKNIYYTQLGRLVWVSVNISGVSNSVNTNFTIPYNLFSFGNLIQGTNNGVNNIVVIENPNGNTTVNLYNGIGNGAWTNSGTKFVRGTAVFSL